MLTDRGANAELDFDAIPDDLIRAHVHLTGHSMAASDGVGVRAVRAAREGGRCDGVGQPGSVAYIDALGAERFAEVIAGADVLFASLVEGDGPRGRIRPRPRSPPASTRRRSCSRSAPTASSSTACTSRP